MCPIYILLAIQRRANESTPAQCILLPQAGCNQPSLFKHHGKLHHPIPRYYSKNILVRTMQIQIPERKQKKAALYHAAHSQALVRSDSTSCRDRWDVLTSLGRIGEVVITTKRCLNHVWWQGPHVVSEVQGAWVLRAKSRDESRVGAAWYHVSGQIREISKGQEEHIPMFCMVCREPAGKMVI